MALGTGYARLAAAPLALAWLAACGPSSAPEADAAGWADAAPGGGGADASPGGGGADAGPGGSCADGSCPVQFRYPAAGVSSVELRGDFAADGWEQGIALTPNGDYFTADVDLPDGRVVVYKFVVNGADWVPDPENPEQVDDGFGGVNSVKRVDCGCGLNPFDWRDSIMYFVVVDRFRDGDPSNNAPVPDTAPAANYAGGDLVGLRQKIEDGYFTDLGVNTLWLTAPIDNADGRWIGSDGQWYSAFHGYWPSVLDAVEERIGTMLDLVAVVDAAHERGIKVVLDYVMNHVHVQSPIYAEHPEWFWSLADCGVCGEGCSWDNEPDRRQCWFRDYLPDFNFTNAEARAYSVNNAIEWIKWTGVDGYRLDAVKHIETQWILDLRNRLRAEIETGGETFYLIGETFDTSRELIRDYVNPTTMLDGQFDFPQRAEVVGKILARWGSMHDLVGFLDSNEGFYGAGSVMGTFIGNHDLPRAIHIAEDTPMFSEWDSGKWRSWTELPGLPQYKAPFERVAVAYTLLMTTPGIPLIYYGDEIGLPGGGDPDNRRFMQWDGLNADQTWLRDRLSRLTAIRAEYRALRRGWRTNLAVEHDTFVYEMAEGDQRVYVALNRGDWEQPAGGLPEGSYRELVTDQTMSTPITIPARTGWVFVRE